MKTVVPDPRFVNLSMEEIEDALDICDEFDDDEAEGSAEPAPCGEQCACGSAQAEVAEALLIVKEVERLIAAYSERFEAYCEQHEGEIPEEALLFRPESPIAQISFGIFTEALHDSMMDEDDE